MGYTQVGLEQKILEMYPEISQNGISAGISFDEGKNAWIIKFKKDGKELTTHLEKKDADDCMNNIKCVYLGIQVEQFIKNFGMRKQAEGTRLFIAKPAYFAADFKAG